MDYKALKWSVHDNPERPGEPAIGVITLNRPDRLNAVDPLMRLELDALCNEIARNSIVKVVILTGEGRGFCAGGDLTSEGEVLGAFEGGMGITGPYKEMAEYFFNDLRHRVLQSAMRKLEDLPQVTIAAINGPAVGVGLEMATLCDMRIASDRARFGEVAVPAGFVPESGGARNLPKLIGIGRAMRLILTGEIIDAKEALRIGLVDEVVRHGKLLDTAFGLAGKIAANPYLSVRHAKRLGENVLELEPHRRRLSTRAGSRAGNYPNERLPGRHARVRRETPAALQLSLRCRLAISVQDRAD